MVLESVFKTTANCQHSADTQSHRIPPSCFWYYQIPDNFLDTVMKRYLFYQHLIVSCMVVLRLIVPGRWFLINLITINATHDSTAAVKMESQVKSSEMWFHKTSYWWRRVFKIDHDICCQPRLTNSIHFWQLRPLFLLNLGSLNSVWRQFLELVNIFDNFCFGEWGQSVENLWQASTYLQSVLPLQIWKPILL